MTFILAIIQKITTMNEVNFNSSRCNYSILKNIFKLTRLQNQGTEEDVMFLDRVCAYSVVKGVTSSYVDVPQLVVD